MLQRESAREGVQQAQQQGSRSEDVVPYTIQISQKYLDLTKRKLELTRLPREALVPKEKAWEYGTPKGEVEALVDYWLETYNWRAREEDLNTLLPQFRTHLTPLSPPTGTTPSPAPLRIHFMHHPSPHLSALPLLYLHSSLGLLEATKLIPLLTHPESEGDIAFHVVAPSLPGWGFGEKAELGVVEVAGLWDGLMVRELGYRGGYVAVGEGGGWGLPLLHALSTHHPKTCLATHVHGSLYDLQPPSLAHKPFHYLRYLLASGTRASLPLFRFGYTPSDFPPRRSFRSRLKLKKNSPPPSPTITAGSNPQTLQTAEPQTLTYALTDSPAGLLALILSLIHNKNPSLTLPPRDIIDLTMLTWLPGPESLLRWRKDTLPGVPRVFGEGWSDVPMGVSAWSGAATVSGAGSGITGQGNGDSSEGMEEDRGCPIPWLSVIQPVKWVRRRGGVGGWVAWERAAELVGDWREFFGGVVTHKERAGAMGVATTTTTATTREPTVVSETVPATAPAPVPSLAAEPEITQATKPKVATTPEETVQREGGDS
ncbi:MAG: hypothetical protein M1839_008979 [Geoglossum umbratile]|nr:MAG: hypothetical protein M1839_008979 [Geoglossum umbratile]